MPRGRIRLRIHCALLALLLVSALSWAQDAGSSDQETIAQLAQQIKQLQQQDRDLQERIRILEAREPQASPVADPPSAPAPPQAEEQTPPPQLPSVTPRDWHEVHGIQWRGFGEVNYKVLDQRRPELGTYGFNPGSAGNFYTGDFDLFLHSRLTEKASVLADLAFEEIEAQSYKLDMRQALLKYDMNEHLRMSVGRYQTGIGYYNSAYRSAAWLQTSANRPLIMEYAANGGLIPTQAVGISLTGTIPSGKLGLNYIAQYGSSNTVRPDIDSGLPNAENDGNHVLLGVFARPDWAPGLQAGSSFFHDKLSNTQVGEQEERYGQTILNAYVVYLQHGFELLNEGFLIRHSERQGPDVFNMPAFYTQLSRQFGRIRPFVRYQYVNANSRSIFNDVLLRYGPSFGARYELNDFIAFKAQLDHTVRKGQPDLNGLQLQLTFTF